MEPRGQSGHWVALGDRAWYVESVWKAAQDLPVEQVPIAAIREVDEDCWFNSRPATVRAVVDHAKRILAVDHDIPVILASDGQVLDGMHRIARAVLEGRGTVPLVACGSIPTPTGCFPANRRSDRALSAARSVRLRAHAGRH
jgi:hypothetical protein